MKNRISACISALVLSLACSSTAFAATSEDVAALKPIKAVDTVGDARVIKIQSTNPVCANWDVAIPAPVYASASGTFPASAFLGHCTDPNGYSMTVISPATPYNWTLGPGVWSMDVPFSVRDSAGGVGSATVHIHKTGCC